MRIRMVFEAQVADSEDIAGLREQVGMSPVHYINAVKIERACRMLRSSDMTVSGVCEFLGFYDVAYFHKVFKKYTGATPGEYCREFREGH